MSDLERGERIKQLREQQHLTQPAVADMVGVTLRGYQEWEAGGGLRWENAKRLAGALRVSSSYIMRGDEPETPDLSNNGRGLEERINELTEQIRLLRAETAARDAEVLKRIDAALQTSRRSQRQQRPRSPSGQPRPDVR